MRRTHLLHACTIENKRKHVGETNVCYSVCAMLTNCVVCVCVCTCVDAIVGIDVTSDGRYVLATTASYLLLIPTGLSTGKTGFQVCIDPVPATRNNSLEE